MKMSAAGSRRSDEEKAVTDAELRDLICLTMVPGVGPQTCRALVDHFKTAGRVLDASMTSLKSVDGVGPKLAELIRSARRELDPETELAMCRQHEVRPVPRGSDEYPARLAEIPDPPSLLYVRGAFTEPDAMAIAIVGARHCTPYGMRIAEKLGASLARVGLTVVSGLARGIDAAAHRGALRAGGRTIAVLANGLAQIYPPEHEGLAKEVAAAGAVVSESPMRQEPLAGLFPQRNRLISGVCLGVVIVEATPRSGSLVTARHAMEQNREVFAVPGPVDSLASVGCHRLIRDGARLVETVDDILEELGPLVRDLRPSAAGEPPARRPAELALSDLERTILGRLCDTPAGVDQLISETGLTAAQVMATLSVLEMRRLARRMPGQMFVRV
jgi:DNA processing protein